MKKYRAFAASALALIALAGATATTLPLTQVADIALPGNATRLDYQSLDAQRHLLFIAHLGDSEVVVVDTKARRVIATIPNVSQVHGVLAVPALHTVYASATGTNDVVAIDEKSFKIVGRTDGGVYPDGLAFDPGTKRIFVSDEHGNTDTVIDTKTNRRIATIGLGGDIGNTQYDAASHHIFVNVQGLGQLAEIDPVRLNVIRRISTQGTGCIGNHGLLIDARKQRAFVACESSDDLLWIDMRTMRIMGTWPIGEGPDVLALDEKDNRLFIASESGTVSVLSNGRAVAPLAQAFLASAAHTVAVDSRDQTVYFPLENAHGKPVLRIMKER